MKSFIFIFTFLMLAATNVKAQKLEFNIQGMQDTTIFLARYVGPKLYYADTAYSKNGKVVFDGNKHPRGLYAVITPGTRFFEFIIDNEVVNMSAKDPNDLIGTMTVNKSVNNKVFYDYIMFMTEQKKTGNKLNAEYDTASEDRKTEIQTEMKSISGKIKIEQQRIYENNKTLFIGVMVLMSMDPTLPDPPKDANGVITDSNFVYNYYIDHFWDGVPLNDASIVRTPVFHNKLDKFFSQQGILQIPDSITKHAKRMIDQMDMNDQDNKVFQYTVHHITQKYEASKIMGMDRVFVYMADNYYCGINNKAYWMSEDNTKKLCERADKIRNTMIGEVAPMIILPDTTEEKWYNSHKVEAEYTILYFWDPNCGHCKKTTPKLQVLYDKKFKERGIEIFAIGKATGEDFEAWKKYIYDNELTFTNVGLTRNIYNIAIEDPRPLLSKTTIQSLNYTDTYDIYSTPRIFILDKNKIIRFKQLSIGQLEEILDNLTGHSEDVKLYPKEDPENGPEAVDDSEH
jgi:thiol-disulfide isomerase/thioredoxin